MHWKVKALIQNFIARLPPRASHACYYAVQRLTGSFRQPQIAAFRDAALAIRQQITRQKKSLEGATFLEVGTGRRLTLPVYLWLLGARRVVTVDLHRYVQHSIVALDLQALVVQAGQEDPSLVDPSRLSALRELLAGEWNLRSLGRLCAIEYVAPADAARLDLAEASVDYHVSFTVFEHIPRDILQQILREAARVLRPGGLAIHLIDHSDHFSHSDASISAIHFLQYDDATWAKLADNPYMYMNRLRVDDYPALYAAAGHEIVLLESSQSSELLIELKSPAFRLDARFAGKDPTILATTASWVVSRPVAGP